MLCLFTQYDGTINDDHFPYLIDLVNTGSVITSDFEIPMPERYFVPGQRELIYVPGSNYITMYLWGKYNKILFALS